MDQRLSVVTLGVRNLKRARAFYEKLGWKESRISKPNVAFFQLNGMVLCLWPRKELLQDSGIKRAGKGFANFALACNVRTKAEVKRVLARAKKAGAKITQPARDVFWGGHNGYFTDPDGYAWEVAWNPGWPMDRKGNVKLPR